MVELYSTVLSVLASVCFICGVAALSKVLIGSYVSACRQTSTAWLGLPSGFALVFSEARPG